MGGKPVNFIQDRRGLDMALKATWQLILKEIPLLELSYIDRGE